MFRRLGTSLAQHRASLSSELGSLWDFLRPDRDRDRHRTPDRRRSAPSSYEPIHDSKSPARLARDLLQVVQETVCAKKFDERRCPLVKEESDLSSEEGTDRRIANLIDFFFTIVKSQKDDRKSSSGSCFKTESPTEVKPRKVNIELEKKMETLMEFLATTGCMEEDTTKDEKKITLMEFLFGPENKPLIEINHQIEKREMTLSESSINVKLSYIDETPVEEGSNLVDMLIEYMENYEKEPTKSMLTPSLSEKSKSDITISKIETFSDMSKTKSDSTLTHTQDTVIEREIDIKSDRSQSSRRISETVVDLSNVKQDLEDIFAEAVAKVCELREVEYETDDTMSEAEDMQNFHSYTKPPLFYNIQCMPYSVELSDILEEDESLDPSSRGMQEDRMTLIRECAEELLDYIEDKIQNQFDESSEDEFDISASLKRSSVSLIDLRSIPDLPPSMIFKPKVVRVDKSTSTTEISDSISEMSKRIESGCMTDDTSLSNSSERQAERALDKLESLHKFFSRSRLEIISEHDEEKNERKRSSQRHSKSKVVDSNRSAESKHGQASLDDVEELQDEVLDDDVEIRNDVILEDDKEDLDEERKREQVFVNDDVNFEHCAIDDSSEGSNDKINDGFDNNVLGCGAKYNERIPDENDFNKVSNDSLDSHEICNFYRNKDLNKKFESKNFDKEICQSAQTQPKVVQPATDRDISESDFTEIDKIISEAVKMILANELEFHNERTNLKRVTKKLDDKLKKSETFDFDRNIKRRDYNNMT